jgi:hypothetical protein
VDAVVFFPQPNDLVFEKSVFSTRSLFKTATIFGKINCLLLLTLQHDLALMRVSKPLF